MAMIPCPECRQSVSKQARACPHCGRQRPGRDLADRILAWGLVLILGVLVSLCTYSTTISGLP